MPSQEEKPQQKRRPYVVVLTGGIASGKTAVSNGFARRGVPVVDTDIIAREVVQPGQPALAEIVRVFGHQVLNEQGQLNRAQMRELIFSDPSNRQRLEAILHPVIREHARRQILNLDSIYCILVVPLLAESGSYPWTDRVLVVDADEQTQIQRVMRRDGINQLQAKAILKAQASRTQRLNLADDVIDNSGSLEDLERQISDLDDKYRQLAISQTGVLPEA